MTSSSSSFLAKQHQQHQQHYNHAEPNGVHEVNGAFGSNRNSSRNSGRDSINAYTKNTMVGKFDQKQIFIFVNVGLKDMNDHEKVRALWWSQLEQLRFDRPDLRVEMIEVPARLGFKLPMLKTLQFMQKSTFCAIPQGDLPYTHRIFDAIVAECIPVTIRTPLSTWYGTCDSHYVKDTPKSDRFVRFPCVNLTYPFPDEIPWRDIIVEIPKETFFNNGLASFLLSITQKEISAKIMLMRNIKELLVYDETGTTYDAFSAIMQKLCDYIL